MLIKKGFTKSNVVTEPFSSEIKLEKTKFSWVL